MNDKKPNFLMVGAAKAGTTSMYHYLSQHPEIYMSVHKEPLFFTVDIYSRLSPDDPRRDVGTAARVYTAEDYMKLFEGATDEKVRGEGSATYLYYHRSAIPRIKEFLGDVKILIMLRDPVSRAYSSYRHLVRDGVESLSFEEFLDDEERRKKDNWDILNIPRDNGFYYQQVKAYMDSFSEVHVILFDDFKKDTRRTVQEAFRFLGVDPAFETDVETRYNETPRSKHRVVNKLLNRQNPVKRIVKSGLRLLLPPGKVTGIKRYINRKTAPRIDAKTAGILRDAYRQDILKLQGLLDRDLSFWL